MDDEIFAEAARAILDHLDSRAGYTPRAISAPYRRWGSDIEAGAVTQMKNACALPVTFRGALMPDAHVGYGLPIGGVIGVEGAVIPYAVGMDIGCRMKLSILDRPISALERGRRDLEGALLNETSFGVGASFSRRRDHRVMDEDWKVSDVTAAQRDRAWAQLGTSGSGNHFVEFGVLEVETKMLGVAPGKHLALLSHSGARGAGAEVAKTFSRMAMDLHPELPKELIHLAWLPLDDDRGREYWRAMELMGRYSAANHQLIHQHVTRALGAQIIGGVENHHNFAWRERHFDRDLVVHRKGATPAGEGVLGVIPGSMGTPGYVVKGRGEPESLSSAAHGAGRRMSRAAAKKRFTQADVKRFLDKRRVRLISADVDEAPMAYKDIDQVMAAQADLVEPVATFHPRLVRMAPPGERSGD